jgi:curli production assembly/transport component CsgE
MFRSASRALLSLLSIAWIGPAWSAADASLASATPASAAPTAQLETWGIVTHQPVTVAGHEFCHHFVMAWRDQPGSERYTVAIRERPSARWGSLVWIEFGQQRVLQLQLPPARAGLKALAESAADTAYQSILDIERQRRLLSDADLAPDEF